MKNDLKRSFPQVIIQGLEPLCLNPSQVQKGPLLTTGMGFWSLFWSLLFPWRRNKLYLLDKLYLRSGTPLFLWRWFFPKMAKAPAKHSFFIYELEKHSEPALKVSINGLHREDIKYLIQVLKRSFPAIPCVSGYNKLTLKNRFDDALEAWRKQNFPCYVWTSPFYKIPVDKLHKLKATPFRNEKPWSEFLFVYNDINPYFKSLRKNEESQVYQRLFTWVAWFFPLIIFNIFFYLLCLILRPRPGAMDSPVEVEDNI